MATRSRSRLVDRSVELDEDTEYVNLLVYATSGTGKTVFGSSDDVLFIAPEDSGLLSAKRNILVPDAKVKKWPVRKWDDAYDAYQYWSAWANEGKKIPHKWFVIDSLSELQEFGMRDILERACKNNPARDPDIPALQDYLKNQAQIRRLVKGFNELPVNILYTARMMQHTNSEGHEETLPEIKGGAKQGHTFAREICGATTSFGYMQVRRVRQKGDDGKLTRREERRITWKETTTNSEGTITAKDRTGVLAPYTTDLTLRKIREMIEAGPAPEPKPKTRRPAARRTTTTRRRKASA